MLAAFLAGRSLLGEGDVTVDALVLHVPERLAEFFGIGLAGDLECFDRDIDRVITAEAFRQAADVVTALLPLVHVALGRFRILDDFREPGREEHGVERAVGGFTSLVDQLVRRVRAAAGNEADVELLFLRLLQDDRELFDRGGYEQRVAARRLDLGELRGEVGGLRIHRLRDADLNTVLLQHLREFLAGTDAEVVVGVEEVGLLDVHLLDQRLEGDRFHRGGRADAEDVGIAGRGDLARGRGLHDHRNLVFLKLRHHGERERRAPRADHERHAVFLDELFDGADGFRRIRLVVLYDELDLLAQHAACPVDLVFRDAGTLRHIVAGRGECAGERLGDTDLDHVLRVCAGNHTAGQHGRRRHHSC